MDLATLGLIVDEHGAVRALDRFSSASDRATRSGSATERMTQQVTRALGALGVALSVHQMIEYADTWKLISGRISLVTSSSAELATVQNELFGIANRSRNAFEGTADLYSKMARNAAALHASQADVLKVTEATAKGFTVSGASAESARAAIIQLGQAMGSGTLRGDELNSVMEQAPRLAEAIATGLGTSIGQLRKLGAEGKLTSKQVFDAILSQSDAIEKEFGRMPVTVGQSFQVLGNYVMRFVGQMDSASGVSSDLASAILYVAKNLSTVIALVAAAGTAWIAYQVATKAAAVYTAVLTGAQTIQAFFQLVKMIRSAADAMALFQILGKGAVGVIAGVVAGTVGFLAYKKLLAEVEQESKKWSDGLVDLNKKVGDGAAGLQELTTEQKHALEQAKKQRESNEDAVRVAQQGVELAKLQGLAQRQLQIEFDAVNKTIEARRALTGDLLTQTLAAIQAEKDLKLEAATVADGMDKATEAIDKQKQVLANFTENVQRNFADMFTKVLQDGVQSFGDLFDAIRQMFFRLVAEMAAAQLTKKIGGALAGAIAGVVGTAGVAGAQTAPVSTTGAATGGAVPVVLDGITVNGKNSLLRDVLPYLAVAGAGFGVGSAIGGMTSNRALGTGGGAIAGAGVGAAIGTFVLPVVGTMVGAAVGGIAGAIGGFIGSSKKLAEEQARQREVVTKNNTQLEALRLSMDHLARVSGDSLSAASPLVARIIAALAPGGSGINSLGTGDFEKAFGGDTSDPRMRQLLSGAGMSLQELAAIAQQVGITLFDSAGKLVPEALTQLEDAIGLTAKAITSFGDSLDEVKHKQDAYNKLFDVERTPQNQLNDAFSILSQMAPELVKKMGLDGLDLTSGGGRSSLLSGLQDIYRLIDTGSLTTDLLGAFSDKNQLLDAILSTKDGLDAFNQSLSSVTTDFPRAMDVVLYEYKYGRGVRGGSQVITPRDTSPSTPPRQVFHLNLQPGAIVTQARNGDELLSDLEAAVSRRAARGGVTYLPNTVIDE